MVLLETFPSPDCLHRRARMEVCPLDDVLEELDYDCHHAYGRKLMALSTLLDVLSKGNRVRDRHSR